MIDELLEELDEISYRLTELERFVESGAVVYLEYRVRRVEESVRLLSERLDNVERRQKRLQSKALGRLFIK